MSSEWKEVSVSGLIDIIGGGTPSTRVAEYWDGFIPWISVKDFPEDEKYIQVTERSITQKGLEESSTKLLNKDDIIISARGTVGKIAMLSRPMAFNQTNYGLRGKPDLINQHFLYYALNNSVRMIRNHTHGSVFDTITRRTFDEIYIKLPPLPTQKAIADTLSCLDAKIEVNNKINENLEAQAQAIFKSWFVDFEPFQDGKFVESELGMIPEGWSISSIQDISQEVVTGKTPSTKKEENYGDHTMFITIPDMRDQVYVIQTERYLSEVGINTQSQKMLPRNSIMVSCIATAGLVSLTSDFSHTNQQINTIIPKEGIDPYFVFLYMQTLSRYINDLGSGGTTTVNLNKRQFSNIKLMIPPKTVFVKFNKLVEPIFKIIEQNQHQNITLANLRDTLLPKLMSGEIEVPVE